jgi:hypothetical protein
VHKTVPWREPGVGWIIGYYNLAGLPADALKQVNPEARSSGAERWHRRSRPTTQPI